MTTICVYFMPKTIMLSRIWRSGFLKGPRISLRDPGRGGETVVRLLVERAGRRTLRAFDERFPERIVDAGNETDIRGVVVFVGNTV